MGPYFSTASVMLVLPRFVSFAEAATSEVAVRLRLNGREGSEGGDKEMEMRGGVCVCVARY